MAVYEDLRILFNDPNTVLRGRVEVAVIIAAEAVGSEAEAVPNHAARLIWAARAFGNPAEEGRKAYMAVLAANNGATITNIKNASDTAIQTNVDAVVDILAGV